MTETAASEKTAETVVSLRLPTDLKERIERIAQANERTWSAEARIALRRYADIAEAAA